MAGEQMSTRRASGSSARSLPGPRRALLAQAGIDFRGLLATVPAVTIVGMLPAARPER